FDPAPLLPTGEVTGNAQPRASRPGSDSGLGVHGHRLANRTSRCTGLTRSTPDRGRRRLTKGRTAFAVLRDQCSPRAARTLPPFWIVSTAMHCGHSVAHNRVTCTQFGLELSAYSRAEHAEPVAFGVLHDHPVHFALADRDDLGALRLQTPDLPASRRLRAGPG